MIRKRTTITISVAALLVVALAVSSLSLASKRVGYVSTRSETYYDPNIPDMPYNSPTIIPDDDYDPNLPEKTGFDPNSPEISQCSVVMLPECRNYYDPNIP